MPAPAPRQKLAVDLVVSSSKHVADIFELAPAAYDLTVTSPLNQPSFLSEAGLTAGSAAVATELRKHSANDVMCVLS